MKCAAAVLLAVFMLFAAGSADERNLGTKCGDFWYALNDDGTARLTACFNVDEELELPAELDGVPVTVVGYLAFLYYSPSRVTLPEGISEFQFGAFYENDRITSVTLPHSLAVMNDNPFINCPNLSEIILPEDHAVFEITGGMLMHRADERVVCPVNGSEEIIIIPAEAKVIGNGAFYENKNVKQIRIHDHIIEIGDRAFAGCSSLAGIVIPASVEYIGEYALDGVKHVVVFRDTYAEEYCIENGIAFEYFD